MASGSAVRTRVGGTGAVILFVTHSVAAGTVTAGTAARSTLGDRTRSRRIRCCASGLLLAAVGEQVPQWDDQVHRRPRPARRPAGTAAQVPVEDLIECVGSPLRRAPWVPFATGARPRRRQRRQGGEQLLGEKSVGVATELITTVRERMKIESVQVRVLRHRCRRGRRRNRLGCRRFRVGQPAAWSR